MLIGLSGKKEAGKSTVTDYLVKHHQFHEVSWAKPLKEIVGKQLFGMTDEQLYGPQSIKETIITEWNKSPRQILQLVGTDWFRKQIHPDFWVKVGLRKIMSLDPIKRNIVVSDNRFPNECNAVKAKIGVNIDVVKLDLESTDTHDSETALDGYKFDYVIKAKHGEINSLYNQIDKILEELRNK